MPFLGDDVSFFILLPEGPGGLDDTMDRLSVDFLRDAMSRTFPVNMEIGVPKFRWEQTFNLRNVTNQQCAMFERIIISVCLVRFYKRSVSLICSMPKRPTFLDSLECVD